MIISLTKRPFLTRLRMHYIEYRSVGMARAQAARWAWFLATGGNDSAKWLWFFTERR